MKSMLAARTVAEVHGGAMTARMAAEGGITPRQLHWLTHTAGVLANIERGVYVLQDITFPFAEVAAYVYLTAERLQAPAAASHDTALSVHGVTDAMPSSVYITAGREAVRQRHPVQGVRIRFASLPDSDRTIRGGVPVTTIVRTIVDIAGTNADLAHQAAAEVITKRRVVSTPRLARQIMRQVPGWPEQKRVARVLGIRGLITEMRKQR